MSDITVNRNVVIAVVLVVVLVVLARSTREQPCKNHKVVRGFPDVIPVIDIARMSHAESGESGDRVDLDQAVDRMRGRTYITNQPEQLQRAFDRELDGVGSSLNDTF